MENLKNIKDVPISETLDVNLLAENNGKAEKLPTTKLQSDLLEQDETSPAYVKGKEEFLTSAGGIGVWIYNMESGTVINHLSNNEDMSDMRAWSDTFWERLTSGIVIINVTGMYTGIGHVIGWISGSPDSDCDSYLTVGIFKDNVPVTLHPYNLLGYSKQ